MKPHRSILAAGLALALISTSARAETLPIYADAAGSPVTNTIAKAAGAAKTFVVSSKSTAYIDFGARFSGIDPAKVSSARLILYFAKVTKAGTLSIGTANADFAETFLTKTIPAPGVTPFATMAIGTDSSREFIIIDVTTQVKAWLTNTSTDHGFALAGDATLNCTIATKEGAASGHPAVLEVDVDPVFTIGPGSIDGTQLATGAAVANLTDGSVALAKLASSTLTLTAGTGLSGGGSVALGGNVTLSLGSNLTLGGTTSGTFSGDGSALTNLPAPTNVWKLGGNSGTTAGTHFLGTTDDQPVEFKVNGQRVLRLEYVDPVGPGVGVNVIGGSSSNSVGSFVYGATIFGGDAIGANQVTSPFGTVGGGFANTAGDQATVSGGSTNTASGAFSMIAGGEQNVAAGRSSFAAGTRAVANHDGAFVWADVDLNNDFTSTADGQFRVRASGGAEIVGNLNVTGTLTGNGSGLTGVPVSIADGSITNAKLASSALTVTAGAGLSGGGSVSLGGSVTLSLGTDLTLGGTTSGTFSGNGAALTNLDAASITTGNLANNRLGPNIPRLNSATTVFTGSLTASSFTGDGSALTNLPAPTNVWNLGGNSGTIAGTHFLGTTDNVPVEFKVNGQRALRLEYASDIFSTSVNVIGGFSGNAMDAGVVGAVIGGGGQSGFINQVTGDYGIVGGGYGNTAAANAAVGGGVANAATGGQATVPGGENNTASGAWSFAAGFRAKALHQGSFVWASYPGSDFASTANSQFNVRAQGGYRLFSDLNATLGVSLAPNGTAWGVLSDQNAKKNFAPVDVEAVLDRLAAVPVQRWNYKSEPDDAVPHLGPMAQAFKAAFYPGRDDKVITTLEFDGVELAAIQGLNQKLTAKLAEKDAEIAELRERLARIERALDDRTVRVSLK